MIVTANSWFNTIWDIYKVNTLLRGLARHGLFYHPIIIGEKPIMAFVNKGRWIVQCECGGAEYMWEEGLFLCQSCWNGKHGHRVRKAIFPWRRKRIEVLLNVRPLDNRNWYQYETVKDLEKENEEHKAELIGV